jgi:hypothetical protein
MIHLTEPGHVITDRSDADGRAGPGLPHGAGRGVGQGQGRGGGRRAAAHGHDAGDAAPAGRPPEPVRPLAAPERDAVQRLRPLVPARTDRRLERDAPAGPNLIPHPYAYCSPCS